MIVLFAVVYGEKKKDKVSLESLEKVISVWGSE